KHSAEFLAHTPNVARALANFGDDKAVVADSVLALASQFADRTGGMTADLWLGVPDSLEKLSAENAVLLMRRGGEFLEFGGSVTLHFVASGSNVVASSEDAFAAGCAIARSLVRY